ncbi:hypothetical protein [Azonexus sp.]|uniref:hypothetical protein n=1 Tax=Azonexus sp. TaxID=1872668 RepID=UPI0035B4D4D2
MAAFYLRMAFSGRRLTFLLIFKLLILGDFYSMPRFLAGQAKALFLAGLRRLMTALPQTYPQLLGISRGGTGKSSCLPLRRRGGRIAGWNFPKDNVKCLKSSKRPVGPSGLCCWLRSSPWR